jgi:NADH:ubiquinone oxidoreductase subunit K
MLAAVIIAAVGLVGIAIWRRTVWWLPGGVLLASAGILTLDAILLQDQNFGYVLRLIELWGAAVSAMVGLVLIHGVAAFRRYLPRRATLVSTRRLVDWPSARVHSAKQRARLAHVYDPQA